MSFISLRQERKPRINNPMRLVDILPDSFLVSPYLMEVNLLNAVEVKGKIASMSDEINSPKHRKWFQSQMYKHILSLGDDSIPYLRQSMPRRGFHLVNRLPKDAPPWAKEKYEMGNIYTYHPPALFLARSKEIIKWLNNLNPDKSINMTFMDAYDATEKWMNKEIEAEKEKKRQKMLRKGTKVVEKYPNGHYWVRLENAECIDDEGRRQQNCLKGTTSVELKNREFYSLRDANDKSLVTLMAIDDIVFANEVKMKQNDYPHEEYFEYILDLMVKNSFVLGDIEEDEDDEDSDYDIRREEWENFIFSAQRSGYSVHQGNGGVYFVKEG